MERAYYQSSFATFARAPSDEVLGTLVRNHGFELGLHQKRAWLTQIQELRATVKHLGHGHIFFEYAIPRMGKRADVVLLHRGAVFVIEYKVGEESYSSKALRQTIDYALDLKNFHAGSHDLPIVPILVATRATPCNDELRWSEDNVAEPLRANSRTLKTVLIKASERSASEIDVKAWLAAAYKPTPTIVEAAKALYKGHHVSEISRSDAGAINLTRTADVISDLIETAKRHSQKTVCFVTGVPGSGKTLAGLNLATERMRTAQDEHAVFLSGNGPLVQVLREALARDEVDRSKLKGQLLTKTKARQKASVFVQNIHHFRDECLRSQSPPVEKVVVFDEAQRAWDRDQTSKFMTSKRQQDDFDMSEPAFLLSAMDRHQDWCVVVCLVGGGQEINTGEAGLLEWFKALEQSFPHWRVAFPSQLEGQEYRLNELPNDVVAEPSNIREESLNLAVSVRSYRAENVSNFVAAILDGNSDVAADIAPSLSRYPFLLTRSVECARAWLKSQARGSERFGLVASSNGMRLKPVGVFVKSRIDPANWFLNDNEDIRSSFALEDVATEFDIQGLELDWVGVCWDANLRHVGGNWSFHRFSGSRWQAVRDPARRRYLVNSYRVLLTRARQGCVVIVPAGTEEDPTRNPPFYDGTYDFLLKCGLASLD